MRISGMEKQAWPTGCDYECVSSIFIISFHHVFVSEKSLNLWQWHLCNNYSFKPSAASRTILSNWNGNPIRQFQRGDWFRETAALECCGEVVSNVISCLFQIKHKPIMKLGTKYPIVLSIPADMLTSPFLSSCWQPLFHLSFPAVVLFFKKRERDREKKRQTVRKEVSGRVCVCNCVSVCVLGEGGRCAWCGGKEGALKSQWLWGAVRTDSALSLASGGAKLGRAEHCAKLRMMVPLSTGAWLTEMERHGKCSTSCLATWNERAGESQKCNTEESVRWRSLAAAIMIIRQT